MDTTVVLATLILYKIALIGVGVWASRRTASQEDMLLGGRNLGPVVGAISYSASAASAWTLLGMSGAAYVIGLPALWIASGAVLGSIIAWVWIAPRMMVFSRDHNILTLTEFLAFGSTGRTRRAIIQFSSLIILVSFVVYIASQFQGAGNTFALTFHMDSAPSIILGGSVILVYTMLGGFWAVSVTDTLQGILMLLAAVLLPVAAFLAMADLGGFWVGLQGVYDADALTLTGKNVGFAVVGFIFGSLAIGLGAIGQPHLQARFMALRDDKAMRTARVIGISWYTVVFFGMCLLGLMGRALIPEIDNPEDIFFSLTTELFSPLVGAIILAAVLSAVMSTADSMLLVAAGTVSHDLGVAKRYVGKEVFVSRLAITVVCIFSIVVSIYMPASIFTRVLFAWNALGAAFGPLILMRLGGVKINQKAALFAIVTGFGLAVIFSFMENAPGDFVERIVPFITGLTILFMSRK